jgi:hypothetical protein
LLEGNQILCPEASAFPGAERAVLAHHLRLIQFKRITDLLQLLNIKDENWEIRIKSRISAYRKSPETFLTR